MGSPVAVMFACKKIIQLAIKYNIKEFDIYTCYDGFKHFNKGTNNEYIMKKGSIRFIDFINYLKVIKYLNFRFI